MGFFNSGRFNLVVSLRYTPEANELAFLQVFFEQVSQLIFDLTDGAHSIGQVLISTNSLGGADADIWIHPNDDVWPNSTAARLWFPLESVDLSQDYMFFATILAHELSHYLYDVRDEYNNGTSCQGNIATEACLMEGYAWNYYTRWTDGMGNDYINWATFFADYKAGVAVLHLGQPSEFCHAGNHNATANNNQNIINNHQSCWTYIANDANHNNIPYGLTVPSADGPATAAPVPAATAIGWTELIPVQRFMLVLDRSGSMAGIKIEQVKVGANFWVDYVNPGEELGIVTYSTNANLDLSMNEVPADPVTATTWRTSRHTIVDGIGAGGVTSIGDALRIGLNNIIVGGRASSQVMILFTDGLQNWGTETAQDVLPDLVASGVRVYVIGLGYDQDPVLLADIAETTGGRYFSIDGDLDPAAAATAIRDALVELAGESRENGGLVSFDEVYGMLLDAEEAKPSVIPFNWPEGVELGSIPFNWPEGERPTVSKQPLEKFRYQINISEGSSHCTLGALWKNAKYSFEVRVYDPKGKLVKASSKGRIISGNYPYSFYEIDDPEPGKWWVEVIGGNIRNTVFRMIGFEVNNRVRFEVTALKRHIKQGEEIKLRARLLVPQAVPGAKLIAFVRTPIGKWHKVEFVEPSTKDLMEPFLYTATIVTDKRERGQYLICVNAKQSAGTFTFELDELYRQKPGLRKEDRFKKIQIPAVERWAFLSVNSDSTGPIQDGPLHGYNIKPPFVPKDQEELLKLWKKAHDKEKHVKVILDRIQILDDHDPLIKGKGELTFTAIVTPDHDESKKQLTRLPESGVYKVSDKPGKNFINIGATIFDGSVKQGHLSIEIGGKELDLFDPDDPLKRYFREFIGDPEKWCGEYYPTDEYLDKEMVGDWALWYRIVRI